MWVAASICASALMTNFQMIRNILFVQRGLLIYDAVNKTKNSTYEIMITNMED